MGKRGLFVPSKSWSLGESRLSSAPKPDSWTRIPLQTDDVKEARSQSPSVKGEGAGKNVLGESFEGSVDHLVGRVYAYGWVKGWEYV